ncbi:MAG: AraC family transcriptional regulator [Nocardiaceae bacterium]|nr:AraC family transcriptional regulator [Nocardiaceae bacterium]
MRHSLQEVRLHTQVRCATLNGYLDISSELGLDGPRLMRKVGLDPVDLAEPEKWISAPAVARLLSLSARAADRPDFGVLLAERRRLTALGPLSVVLREEPDLRSVLALLIRYEHSYNEALRLELVEHDALVSMRMSYEFGEPAPTTQALTLGLGALHGIISACVGQSWRPVAVCFSQKAPTSRETFHRVFGPALRFEHEFTGLILYGSDLDAPNVLGDPLMRPYAQRILDTVVSPRSATGIGRVRELVEMLLPLGRCSVDQVARALGMDRRTLQRHLAREGESFSGVLHSVRAGLAERHLQNQRYSLTEIADVLGFTAPSAFSRWFSQQFGMSPTQWKERGTKG